MTKYFKYLSDNSCYTNNTQIHTYTPQLLTCHDTFSYLILRQVVPSYIAVIGDSAHVHLLQRPMLNALILPKKSTSRHWSY